MISVLSYLGETWATYVKKMDKFSREMETTGKSQMGILELENTVREIKNLYAGLYRRLTHDRV